VAASTILYGLNIADVECAKRSDLCVDEGDEEKLVFTGLRLAQTVLYLEAYPGHAVPRG
jgi:hypothetical protein